MSVYDSSQAFYEVQHLLFGGYFDPFMHLYGTERTYMNDVPRVFTRSQPAVTKTAVQVSQVRSSLLVTPSNHYTLPIMKTSTSVFPPPPGKKVPPTVRPSSSMKVAPQESKTNLKRKRDIMNQIDISIKPVPIVKKQLSMQLDKARKLTMTTKQQAVKKMHQSKMKQFPQQPVVTSSHPQQQASQAAASRSLSKQPLSQPAVKHMLPGSSSSSSSGTTATFEQYRQLYNKRKALEQQQVAKKARIEISGGQRMD